MDESNKTRREYIEIMKKNKYSEKEIDTRLNAFDYGYNMGVLDSNLKRLDSLTKIAVEMFDKAEKEFNKNMAGKG
jgi:uncharacterized protein YjgD (DUF1641 family)